MTRYSARRRRTAAPRDETPAIWRGIGCLLFLIVPLVAWFLAQATVTVALGNGWPLPYQFLGYPVIAEELWMVPAIWPILAFIRRQPHLYMTLVFAAAYVVVISGVVSATYAVVYRFIGPPRLGPLDLPQPQVKVGRYKR